MSANSFRTTLYGVWSAIGHGAWMLLSVMGIASLVIAVLLIPLASAFNLSEDILMQPEWTLGLYAAQYGIGLFVLLLIPVVLQKKNRLQLRKLFGLVRRPITSDIGLALLAFLPYFASSLALQTLVATVIPGFNSDQLQDVGFNDISGTSQLVIAFVALVVLAPLAEELIFRGYLFGSARERLGFWPAAIITSILFGIVHGQWNVGLDTFVLSIVLCYLREKTGSIWASVLLHAIKNGLAYTLLLILPVGSKSIMRMTQLFTRTRTSAPADEVSKNAQLLIRAGFVHKEMAGVYVFLPLGKSVLENIVQIIREEMNAIGGNEVSMTALQRPEPWQASGRWSDEVMDVWFRTKLANGTELGLGATHEEPLTELMKQFITSYKDLPAYPYQFQTKFRNELRAKSGIMRGREFLMKDLYSFTRDQKAHDEFYDTVAAAYGRVWERLGIADSTYKTFASGGSFAKYSHEFQTISPVGEDTIYVHKEKKIAINEEVYNDEVLADLGVSKDELVQEKAVEVGNIFTLGTKFSDALELTFTDEDGTVKPVIMGSYGIGPSRIMGVLAEHFADDRGLVWPESVAPAKVSLICIGNDSEVIKAADELYEQLKERNITVLYDDRDTRPGEKFADSDLMGIPHRIVVSPKLIAESKYEYKQRQADSVEVLTEEALFAKII